MWPRQSGDVLLDHGLLDEPMDIGYESGTGNAAACKPPNLRTNGKHMSTTTTESTTTPTMEPGLKGTLSLKKNVK